MHARGKLLMGTVAVLAAVTLIQVLRGDSSREERISPHRTGGERLEPVESGRGAEEAVDAPLGRSSVAVETRRPIGPAVDGGSEIAERPFSRVTGRVLGEAGEALSGAEVHLALDRFALTLTEGVPASLMADDPWDTTDAEGRFELGAGAVLTRAGQARLVAERSGYGARILEVPLVPGDTHVGDVVLARQAAFVGVVLGAKGEAEGGVPLTCWPEPAWAEHAWPGRSVLADLAPRPKLTSLGPRRAVSADDGRFELPHAGPWLVVVGEPPRGALVYQPSAETVTPLDLPAAAPLRGRIVDPSEQAIQGATVRLLARAGAELVFPGRNLATDDEGRFAFADVLAGWTALGVTAQGFSQQVVLLPGDEQDDVRIVLRPSRQVEVAVLDSRGEPCDRAELEVTERISFEFGTATRAADPARASVTRAREPGSFLLELPAGGDFRVNARAPGHATAWGLELGPDLAAPLVVRLQPEAVVRGHALADDGLDPLSGVGIWLERLDGPVEETAVVTAASGEFELRQLALGRYRLRALEATRAPYTSEEFGLSTGEVREQDVHLAAGARIAGLVESLDPELKAPWRVRLVPAALEAGLPEVERRRGPETLTRADGTFVFPSVKAGAWSVEVREAAARAPQSVSKSGVAKFFQAAPSLLASRNLRVNPGDEAEVRLVLGLAPAEGCRLQGFLVGMVDFEGAHYEVRCDNSKDAVRVDETGFFDAGVVQAGRRTLSIGLVLPDLAVQSVHTAYVQLERGGDVVVTIELPGHGGLLFEVVDSASGRTLPDAEITFGSVTEPGWGGMGRASGSLRVVRAGGYAAVCQATGHEAALQRFQVDDLGSVHSVRFELRAAGPRAVVLTDSEGAPLAGGQVTVHALGRDELPFGMWLTFLVAAEGRLDISGLPPGIYSATLSTPAGAQVELELDFTLDGQVLELDLP